MSSEYKAKLIKLKKYVPILDAWLIRLRTKKKNEYISKIEQLRELLTNDDTKLSLESLTKCEQVLSNLENKLGGIEDPQNDKPKENMSLDSSRAKLRSLVTKPEPKVETLPNKSETSRPVKTPLFARRSQIDEAISSNTESPVKKQFTRVLKSPDRFGKHENSPLYERRPPREERSSISPRYRHSSSSSRSYDSRKYNKNIDIDLNSFNLGNSDDVIERIFYGKDSDADILQLRLARAKIYDQLREIVPEDEIPNLLMKRFKKKRKRKLKKVEVEEGEITGSDAEIEALYSNLQVEFDNKDFNDYHENRSFKPHRPKIKVNIVLAKLNTEFTNSVEKTIDSGANDKGSEITPSKQEESVSQMSTKMQKQAVEIRDEKNQSLIKNDLSKNDVMISNQTDIKVRELNINEEDKQNKDEIQINDKADGSTKINESFKKDNKSSDQIKSTDLNETKTNGLNSEKKSSINKNGDHKSDKREKTREEKSDQHKIDKSEKKHEEKSDQHKNDKSEKTREEKSDQRKQDKSVKKSDKDDKNKQKSVDVSQTDKKNIKKDDPSHKKHSSKSKEGSSLKSEAVSEKKHKSQSSDDTKKSAKPFFLLESSKKSSKLSDLIESMTPDKKENLKSNPRSSDKSQFSQRSKDSHGHPHKIDPDKTKSIESVPKDTNPIKSVSEQDILKALRNEILEPFKRNDDSCSVPELHKPQIMTKIRDSQILESERKRRISIDTYKQKTDKGEHEPRSTIFDDEEKKLRKSLTAKEFQRFQPVISATIKENLHDPETQSSSRDMSLSPIPFLEPSPPQTPSIADSCPKSPENTDHLTEYNAPKIIPSEPVKNVPTPRQDVDLRKNVEKINSNQSSSIASTPTISDNLSPSFSSYQEKQPLLKAPYPNHLNPKNITYRTYDTTPTHNPFESEEQKRFGFRSNSFQDRNREPVWKNSQSFSAYEPNRLPTVRKTVYAPQLDLSTPFDRGIKSVWDRSPWDRSRTYDNARSGQESDSSFRKDDSSRYNEFDGRNQSRDVCHTANPYFQGSNVEDRYRDSRMENTRENRREFGSDPNQSNSRWTPIDSQQRSLNERDPRSFVASSGPVDANIRNTSTFNRDSGDYNKDAGIYNREKGNYSSDASNYRSEPRNYNDNRENYTFRDPLTYSSRDTLTYSGSYSKNIERVNTRLSSERDNIRSTPTNISNANQNFHSHYTVIDPRRGRQFYNAEKALVNRASNKPNPGYIRESRYDKNANIDYIKEWEPKHIERKNEIDRRFQRAQSVGRELSSESKSRYGGAVSKTKKAATISKVWENVENVIISLRPNFSRSKSVGPKSSRNDARNVERKTSSSHADRVRNFRELKSQHGSNYDKNVRSRSNEFKSSQSHKHAVTAPPVRGKWFDDLAKYDKKYASKDSYKDHWSSKNSNEDRYSSSCKHHSKNYRDSSSERNHTKRSYVDDKRWGRSTSPKRQQGIVYSNDNIARGKAITPGFGVKNYKIPKIKKVEEPVEAEKTPSVIIESAIQVKTSESDKNNTTNKLFDSKENKKSNVKNNEKPILQHTSERKSEIKVQEKSSSNQEKYPSSNKSNAINESIINMDIADKALISEPVKISNDSIQTLSDDAKLQSNKTLIPTANQPSAAYKSPKSFDQNETEVVVKPSLEKSNETKTYVSTDEGKDMSKSSKELNNAPLKELQVFDENSFDSYSEIADEKFKLKLCEIEDSLDDSPHKEEIIRVNQQSVQPPASIETATSNQDLISNKNLLASDNDTERGQNTVPELGSEVRKDNLESKSTDNANNIQDEKEITSSSKDDEIEDISCEGVIEPKDYVSNQKILEENAPDSTENSQEVHKPEDSEASSCSNVPDSTNVSELSQSTEYKNSSVVDDSKSHPNDELKTFLAFFKDPSKLKEVLPMLPAHLRESLQALVQTDHTVSENKIPQLNNEPAIASSEEVAPCKDLDKNENTDIESKKESENISDLEKGGDINTEISDKNVKQPTENTLPQSETGVNETICDIIENNSEPKKSLTEESNKESNLNTPIIDSSESVSNAIDITLMPEKQSETDKKHETCKKKTAHKRELAYLHENLKDYFSTSMFSGTRTCRLTNKADYSENTEKNDNQEKNKALDAFKQKKPVIVVERTKFTKDYKLRKKPGPKPRKNQEKTESFEVKTNEKTDTKNMKNKIMWKDLISAQNSKKASSPPLPGMPRDSYKFTDAVDKSMETLCTSGHRENNTSYLFTDLQYHFKQNESTYPCKLCNYVGDGIVYHYKNSHPDHEVAISRLSSKIAVTARQQASQRDFEIILVSNQKYRNQICRFCSLEFTNLTTLETLFWHIVSTHTGEYKRSGIDQNIVLPSPPTDDDNILLGYMCGHCFYTQLCFDNVSDHAIRHHQREETKVFTICLSEVDFKKSPVIQKKSVRSKTESSSEKRKIDQDEKVPDDDEIVSRRKVPRLVQKITFEQDSEQSDNDNGANNDEKESDASSSDHEANDQIEEPELVEETAEDSEQLEEADRSDETIENKSPVFELDFKNDGSKIYLCKIESCEFSTTLQISFKKHVQIRHATVLWDGACQFCDFKADSCSYANYASHFVIEHLEPLNLQEKENDEGISTDLNPIQSPEEQDKSEPSSPNKSYIQVRPLAELLQTPHTTSIDLPNNDSELSFPVIQSVVSLNDNNTNPSPDTERNISPSPDENSDQDTLEENSSNNNVQVVNNNIPPTEDSSILLTPIAIYREKAITVTSTMTTSKMAQIFKCAGRYCSFTSTTAEPFAQHIQHHLAVHTRENSDVIRCVYCPFTSTVGNELAQHIFTEHGYCGYGCTQCFFVSVNATLIAHHYLKVHSQDGSILKMHEVNDDRDLPVRGLLPKIEAAPEYACPIDGCEASTPTATLFEKHLNESHPNTRSYRCKECIEADERFGVIYMNPKQLITHLKSHGYALYQCTFCYFGTTHDTELFTHYLTHHPNRKLQAYLRLVCADSAQQASSGVSKRLRVPLINLEKPKEVLKVVNGPEESPKDEVERALKLENSLRGVGFQLKTEPEPKNLSAVEESDVICLDSDDETSPEVPPEVPPTQNVISLIDEDDTQATENVLVPDKDLYACGKCKETFNNDKYLRTHLRKCYIGDESYKCPHCSLFFASYSPLIKHMEESHKQRKLYRCWVCGYEDEKSKKVVAHVTKSHRAVGVTMAPDEEASTAQLQVLKVVGKGVKILTRGKKFGPDDVDRLPTKPIFDEHIHCACCEFNSKVRINMIRHLQQHRNEAPTSSAAPVNPVPHLESNEMHFDRMANLASSSHTNSVERPVRPALTASELSRYPRFIQRERLACGAAGCAYISIDEITLRRHWDALHANTPAAASYRCVHCPPTQKLDTSKPLTASRIVAHLRMHAERLYACSACYYYHHQEPLVEKHVSEKHGDRATVFIVREPHSAPLNSVPQSLPSGVPTPSTPSAPTMDLKKWKCGFCEYSNLLRSDVLEHISAAHQLNNRYRCSICPYSNILKENVESHLSFEHTGVECVVLIVYYQEGTVEEMKAGKKLWMYQKEIIEKCRSQVKAEMNAQNPGTSSESQDNEGALQIDLGNIKQEDTATAGPSQLTADDASLFLYGQPGEPDGVKFLCPLCRLYSSVETNLFSDHLYEELGYRSWCCEICSYRGFTESRLNHHLSAEHSGWRKSGKKFNHIQDPNIEAWISLVIRTQQEIINKNSRDLSKSNRWLELQEKFGPSCQPKNGLFACPRCTMQSEDRALIEDHLMRELEIFSWCCSVCTCMFHYYQTGKEHASSHANVPCPISRVPVEWKKEWIKFAVEYQVDIMTKAKKAAEPEVDVEGSSDNELLVVRREDNSTTVPDAPASCTLGADGNFYCPFCSYKSPSIPAMKVHAAPHLGVKPYRCTNCAFMAPGAKAVRDHISKQHPNDNTAQCRMTCSDELLHFPDRNAAQRAVFVCMECEVEVFENGKGEHVRLSHSDKISRVDFVQHGTIVARCGLCNCIQRDVHAVRRHYLASHPGLELNFTMVKVGVNKGGYTCDRCGAIFPTKSDFTCHSERAHPGMALAASKCVEPPKKKMKLSNTTARKSTTKLPSSATARKSTTRLPYDSAAENSRNPPSNDRYKNVVTYISLGTYQARIPFKLDELRGILNIEPKVIIERCNEK